MKYEPSHLARLLRTAREQLGLSRQQLADQIAYTPGYIEKIERGEEPVREEFLRRVTPALAAGVDVPSLLLWLRDDGLRRPVVSEWLRPYLEIEKQAHTIRWFEPLRVPGLLQTEAYARLRLISDDLVAERLARQEVFERDEPPYVVAVVSEYALRTRVGTPEIMAEQLRRLTEGPATVQVLPGDAETYDWLDGSFVLVTVGEREYVYVDTPARGFTLEERDRVADVRQRWDVIRGEALTPRQSRELILEVVETWKS